MSRTFAGAAVRIPEGDVLEGMLIAKTSETTGD
jgi:hypothetical protein